MSGEGLHHNIKTGFGSGGPFGLYASYKIVEDKRFLVPGPPLEIRRTWKERLFSRPWSPLMKTRVEIKMIPDPNVYRIEHLNVLVGHPETIAKLRKGLH